MSTAIGRRRQAMPVFPKACAMSACTCRARRRCPVLGAVGRRHGMGAGQARLPMPSTSDRGWGWTWIPAADGYDERGTGGNEKRRRYQRSQITRSHRGNDLGPDGNHAKKQGDRGQGGGFLHNGAKHDVLPERTKNIVHVCSFVKPAEISFCEPIYAASEKSRFAPGQPRKVWVGCLRPPGHWRNS